MSTSASSVGRWPGWISRAFSNMLIALARSPSFSLIWPMRWKISTMSLVLLRLAVVDQDGLVELEGLVPLLAPVEQRRPIEQRRQVGRVEVVGLLVVAAAPCRLAQLIGRLGQAVVA